MATGVKQNGKRIGLSDRALSVIVFSLFFSWLLAFPFQGKVLQTVSAHYQQDAGDLALWSITAHFAGLLLCFLFIKSMKAARLLMLISIVVCVLVSLVFFFPPQGLWLPAITLGSFLAGGCVAAWSFFFKHGTPKSKRLQTAADALIFSNIAMVFLNAAAVYISPFVGLGLSILVLSAAFAFAVRLPAIADHTPLIRDDKIAAANGIIKPLGHLWIFIALLTINSGLMYMMLNPSFAHLEFLTQWYWALPYIAALFIMRNLSLKVNRTYILYYALALNGISFIAFVLFDRSVVSYLAVDTLMLGSFGVFDLFWWSILGEMLDYDNNPAKILGIGLSANVLGVFTGAMIARNALLTRIQQMDLTLLALGVICVSFAIFPPLHKRLSGLLKDHAFLTMYFEMPPSERERVIESSDVFTKLTERERDAASLLLEGKTYRMIAADMKVSENTVRTHVKNIYGKTGVQCRAELINMVLKQPVSQ